MINRLIQALVLDPRTVDPFDETKRYWTMALFNPDGTPYKPYTPSDGTDGAAGAPGESAYQVWLAQGNTGTVADYLASLVGPKGDKGDPGEPGTPGDKGDPGEPGTPGTPGAPGNPGAPGPSAYEIWLANGHSGTVIDYLASLVGAKGNPGNPGAPGASAYDVWLANGHSGTVADYLASLVGPKGDKGDPGAPGTPGASRTILDEGIALTARSKLDFVGSGVTVTDDATNDKSVVSIPGSGSVADPTIIGIYDFSGATGSTQLFSGRDGDADLGYEVIFEGQLNVPTSLDRFITLRPNGVSANHLATTNSVYSGAGNGVPTQQTKPNIGMVIGATGGAASCAVVGRAVMRSKADRFRTCKAAFSSYGDNNYNVSYEAASAWTDQFTKINSLSIDFQDGAFTGRVILRRLPQPGDQALGMPPRVTALPSTPVDGQEVIFVADAAKGVLWRLKYNGASASAYKWEVLSHTPLNSESVANEGAITSTNYVNLAPQITLPLAGDYDIETYSQLMGGDTAGAYGLLSYSIGATVGQDVDAAQQREGSAGASAFSSRSMRRSKTGLAVNAVIRQQARTTAGNFYPTANIAASHGLRVWPVRVG